jgi:hypothetical protein
MIKDAIHEADHPDNNGNGYTLRVWLRNGATFHGGLLSINETTRQLKLDLWDRKWINGMPVVGPEEPTGNSARIDANEIVACEVCW